MKLLGALAIAGALLGSAFAAQAQDYPTSPVGMVIPFTPGGSNDQIGRYLADGLTKKWGESVVVENRPGAGSAIGTSYVVRAKPDGQTLLFVSASVTTNAATQTNLPFDIMTDLTPISIAAIGEWVAVASPELGVKTLDELLVKAKEKKLHFGTTGVGSSPQFVAELMNSVIGVEMTPTHYKGGTDALVDLAAGRLDLYVGTATQVKSSVESGKAIPVVIASPNRSALFPEVQTIAEAGFPDAASGIWWGVFGPKDIDPALVTKINADIAEVMGTPEAAEFLASQGLSFKASSPDEFKSYVGEELNKWKALAEARGIRSE